MPQSQDRQQRARSLVEQLRQLPPSSRAAAMAAACADDADLEREVSRLLAAGERDSPHAPAAGRALTRAEGLLGRRLGHYEVQGVLGAGGMGEVYRARDTQLGRDVALKILPEAFAADPDRVARFQREAQVLASLNHPHIAAIYGLEEAGGLRALVLELVDGPTLADRIAEQAIPLDEALPIARQIAAALEAAHEQGVIHRDLKPANIKLRPDGTVKVLDFGLAKVIERGSGRTDISQSPTIAGTELGVILGTAPYMSPEQARGRSVDKRSDIWAFGCVVFEMLSGQRAFAGNEVSDILAVVLTRDPDWAALPPETTPPIRRLLRRCLEKDRARRLADIADARLDLDEPVTEATAAQPPRRGTARRWLPWSIAAASAAAALWLGGLALRSRPAVGGSDVYRSSILLPGRLPESMSVALSPDGRRLAFAALDTSGHSQLWIRALDGLAAQPIADTADAYSPFWSPDSKWVAFVQGGKLKKVEAAGGQAVTLSSSAVIGGAWSREDVILFSDGSGALAQVRASGGTPSLLTKTGSNGAEVMSTSPFFLPDGRHFGYVETTFSDQSQAFLGSLDEPAEHTRLPIEASKVQYARGYLWYLRGSTLVAQAFDATRRSLAGDAAPIAEQVRVDSSFGRSGFFSVSNAGMLVYQADPSPGFELVWYDRAGRPSGKLGTPAEYADPRLSPDGHRLLVSVVQPGTASADLWIFDVVRGLRTRLTFEDQRPIGGAIWSPASDRVAFASRREGRVALLVKAANGAGRDEVLVEDEAEKELSSWSPDGRFILYTTRSGGEPRPWVLPLAGDRKALAAEHAHAFYSLVSPDGRWITYMSLESGRWEVYVAPFPGPGGALQVSVAGGMDPQWRGDGKEIFFLAPGEQLMSAAIATNGDRIQIGEVKPLFEMPKAGARGTYDVSADGQRILAVTRQAEAGSAPLTLVVNWPALIEK